MSYESRVNKEHASSANTTGPKKYYNNYHYNDVFCGQKLIMANVKIL